MAFAANSATSQYLAPVAPLSVNVLSCLPSSGSAGTKVTVRLTCDYDLVGSTLNTSTTFASLYFGSQKCSAHVVRESREGNGLCTYAVTADAPQFLSTACPSLSNVPVSLLLESSSGEVLARATNIGVFSYNTAPSGASDGSSPPELGSPKARTPGARASPQHQDSQAPPKSASPLVQHGVLPEDSSAGAYSFSPSVSTPSTAQVQPQAQVHSEFSATSSAYQSSSSMLPSYRTPSYTDHCSRAPPVLRSPQPAGWMYGSQMDALRGSTGSSLSHSIHAPLSRPPLTSMQHTSPQTPQLIRTSTLTQPTGYGGYGVYHEKATLKILGDLSTMAEGWTHEEWENKRRLVLFRKQQQGNVLTVSFKAVSPADRPPHSICISCIWWEEKQACFVTSVDTIHLLEQLLAAPNRFGVDEKNRIRRNLEGFRPATVSKSRPESEEFFKVIMGFGNPKPRNIEKDVKVFQWKDLAGALHKIISKYSASTGPIIPPGSAHGSMPGPYSGLPPTPVSSTSTATTDPSGYGHHDSLTSPRSLAGTSSTWPPAYGPAPKLKPNSPVAGSSLRMSSLPVVYDHRTTHSLPSPYGLPAPVPHSSHSQSGYTHSLTQPSPRQGWDSYSVTDTGYSTQSGSGHHAHSHVYGDYSDGAQRS